LYVEQKKGIQAIWRSERTLRREEKRDENTHFADAEIRIDGIVVGVEVELTPKEYLRITAILPKLAEKYHLVWYFTNKFTYPVVTTALSALSEGETITHKHFTFYSIDTFEPL